MLHWTMAVLVLAILFIGIGRSRRCRTIIGWSRPTGYWASGTIALPRETADAAARQASAADPHDRHKGRHQCYSARKKFNRACWSAGDSISKLKITLLASEPALA